MENFDHLNPEKRQRRRKNTSGEKGQERSLLAKGLGADGRAGVAGGLTKTKRARRSLAETH